LLYAALASGEAAYRAKALSQLEAKENDLLTTVARMLLREPTAEDRKALLSMLVDYVDGPDRVALTALACRRAGSETWQAFRAAAADVLGGQELPGEVIVLVHEISPGPLGAR
jgi:hypothetical protein